MFCRCPKKPYENKVYTKLYKVLEKQIVQEAPKKACNFPKILLAKSDYSFTLKTTYISCVSNNSWSWQKKLRKLKVNTLFPVDTERRLYIQFASCDYRVLTV